MSRKIGFAGMSHLGLVSSIATAAKGFNVVSYDSRDRAVRNYMSANCRCMSRTWTNS